MLARARVCLGAHVSAPKRVSPFCRRGPRVAWLAGVLPGYSIQREHRRVEHRVGHGVDRGRRRFRPAARPCGGRARPVFDALRPLCAAAPPLCVRAVLSVDDHVSPFVVADAAIH